MFIKINEMEINKTHTLHDFKIRTDNQSNKGRCAFTSNEKSYDFSFDWEKPQIKSLKGISINCRGSEMISKNSFHFQITLQIDGVLMSGETSRHTVKNKIKFTEFLSWVISEFADIH